MNERGWWRRWPLLFGVGLLVRGFVGCGRDCAHEEIDRKSATGTVTYASSDGTTETVDLAAIAILQGQPGDYSYANRLFADGQMLVRWWAVVPDDGTRSGRAYLLRLDVIDDEGKQSLDSLGARLCTCISGWVGTDERCVDDVGNDAGVAECENLAGTIDVEDYDLPCADESVEMACDEVAEFEIHVPAAEGKRFSGTLGFVSELEEVSTSCGGTCSLFKM